MKRNTNTWNIYARPCDRPVHSYPYARPRTPREDIRQDDLKSTPSTRIVPARRQEPRLRRLAVDTQSNSCERQYHSDGGFCRRLGSRAGGGTRPKLETCAVPLLMTFLSIHHSPMTVNKNAKVFTMGTVKLSSGEEVETLAGFLVQGSVDCRRRGGLPMGCGLKK